MKRTVYSMAVALLASAAPAAEPAGPPGFTMKPAASKEGNSFRITFAVDRETDVALYVENAKGEIVRHLAAGVLGKNPPEPLKAGSLEQSLLWDGKDDDGNPAGGGPFKVRVGLGLKAGYAGMPFSERAGPDHITGVTGLAAGPDGRVYVMDDRSGWLYWMARAVHVFRRDGSYEKTIKPFPSTLPPERVPGTGAFRNAGGWLNPIVHRTLGMTFYPYEDEAAVQMALTAEGHLVFPVVPSQQPPTGDPSQRGSAPHLALIDSDGGTVLPGYAGPVLGKWRYGEPRLARSSDGKSLYLTGPGTGAIYNKPAEVVPAVYRVRLPSLGPAEVFFGEEAKPGADETHLNNPRGLAADGKGHLLVADMGNRRVVVLKESDARFVASFPVPAPTWVGAHPRTGAVYVLSGESLIKFSGWKGGAEVARLRLPPLGTQDPRARHSAALDGGAEPPLIWIGSNWGGPALSRVEDRGDKLTDPAPVGAFASGRRMRSLSTDPFRREVACQVGHPWSGGALVILDEGTGQSRRFPHVIGEGSINRLGPDGCIYRNDHNMGIYRYDRNGKPKPFASTLSDPNKQEAGRLPGKAGSSGTTAWERDFTVDRRGNLYVKVRGTEYHGLMHVAQYDPDGKFKRTVLWAVTDGSYGPRVDPQGNLYMMECIKPSGEPFPPEIDGRVKDRVVRMWYDWIYGSVVKFPPSGGGFLLKGRDAKDAPVVPEPPDHTSLKKEKVYATFRGEENAVRGALWWRPGFGHMGDMGIRGSGHFCHCTGCDFDVDDFGRTFAPDNGRFRVGVLDARGNEILSFGAYGNQDFCGADSYVLDPKGKFLRPRRPDDPKDRVSPFAKPDIAFGWIVGLAVTDRHAYVADCLNRRVLRVKLDYAAVETAAVP